jgi:hypothetical protein
VQQESWQDAQCNHNSRGWLQFAADAVAAAAAAAAKPLLQQQQLGISH